jgi:hypothetical protein
MRQDGRRPPGRLVLAVLEDGPRHGYAVITFTAHTLRWALLASWLVVMCDGEPAWPP